MNDYQTLIHDLKARINSFCQHIKNKTIGSNMNGKCQSCGLYGENNKCILKVDNLLRKMDELI